MGELPRGVERTEDVEIVDSTVAASESNIRESTETTQTDVNGFADTADGAVLQGTRDNAKTLPARCSEFAGAAPLQSRAELDLDFARRVKAEYGRLVSLAQQDGEVSSQSKKDIASRAIANVRVAIKVG